MINDSLIKGDVRTFKFKLRPTPEQEIILTDMMTYHTQIINTCLSYYLSDPVIFKNMTGTKIDCSTNWKKLRVIYPYLKIDDNDCFGPYGTSFKHAIGRRVKTLFDKYVQVWDEINAKNEIKRSKYGDNFKPIKMRKIPQITASTLHIACGGCNADSMRNFTTGAFAFDFDKNILSLKIYNKYYAKNNNITNSIDIPISYDKDYFINPILKAIKMGDLVIIHKKDKWFVDLPLTFAPVSSKTIPKVIMGIDVGINHPATACIEFNDGRKPIYKFFGNGDYIKFLKIQQYVDNKKRQQHHSIEGWTYYENLYKNMDHKLSREIIDFAQNYGVDEIRIEDLSGIKKSKLNKETSKKYSKNRSLSRRLNSWSFDRLQTMISYKAKDVGITVEKIDARQTSQRCPKCGKSYDFYKDPQKVKTSSEKYSHIEVCPHCGSKLHHDIKGAYNICHTYVARFHKNEDFTPTRNKMWGWELPLNSPKFNKEGYKLMGWQDMNGNEYKLSDKIIMNNDIDLYPVWENLN